MAEEGRQSSRGRAGEARKRIPGSRWILTLAVLFVVATFLAWYFTWFGRELSDADISKYLNDEKNPRHVQHALAPNSTTDRARRRQCEELVPTTESRSAAIRNRVSTHCRVVDGLR